MKIPTRLHKIYEHMMYRCYNPKSVNYKYYGARGIGVCEEWRNNPMLFKKWALSNGYNSTLTLDRIDSNKGYSPDNCRWVTMKEWAKEFHINYQTLKTRIRKGWNIEKALKEKAA